MPHKPNHPSSLRKDSLEERRVPDGADWQRTFDAVPQAVFVLDSENRIQRANRAALKLLGLELPQILGKHCYEAIHNTTEPPTYCPHQSLLQNIRGGGGELAEPRLDKVFDMTCSPVRDAQGSLLGSVHILSDITESKRSAEALVASELRYRRLFEAAKDGILILDAASGEIVDANPFIEKLLRYSHEELVGKKLWDIGLFSDIDRCQSVFKELQDQGQVRYEDLPLKDSDGCERHVEFVSNVYLVGHARVIQCNIRDITERYLAEEERTRLLAILEATSDLVGLADRDGKLTYCNSSGRKMLGLGECQDVTGYNIETFHPAHYKPLIFEEAIPTAVRTGIWKGESVVQNLDGIEIPVSQVLIAHNTADGAVRFLSTIARDITESKVAERRLRQQVDRLAGLRAIDLAINSSLDLRVTLSVFLDQVTARLGVDAADIFLLSPHSQMLEHAAGRGFRGSSSRHLHLHLADDPVGRAVLDRRTVVISDLKTDLKQFTRAVPITTEGFVSYVASPFIAKGRVNGVLEIWHRKRLEPDSDWLGFLESLTAQGAIAIDNGELWEQVNAAHSDLTLAYDTTLEGWVKALDMRDKETEGHTRRVTELTVHLAYDYPVDKNSIVHIRRGALLHDIGKMAVPDALLHKSGPLTPEEWEIMKRHPVYAYDWLSTISYLRPALDIPYCHHEKWDGSGYPRGLKGDSIPLAARLFAVVDNWDALRSDRPYRSGWPKEKVAAHIQEGAGKHFDPQVVEVFLKHIIDYP